MRASVLASGLIFELPILVYFFELILVYFLIKIGLITPELMRKYRKIALVLVMFLSAVITPPDVASQIIVAPVLILYEFSILYPSELFETSIKKADKMLKLTANHITKRYGKRKVVDDVSIEVIQGEIVGLLGPNGAGKTTSFYTIVGLIKPNSGSIVLDNANITSYPMYQRAQNGIGYLAQEASVFRKLSVEDNIRCVGTHQE